LDTKLDRYVALVEEAGPSKFGIVFPDLPGCVATGSTLDEVIANATEALAYHLEGMREDGDDIPAPRGLRAILDSGDDWYDVNGNSSFVVITALPPSSASERINISIETSLLRAIDTAAERAGTNRSAWISRAAKTLLTA
jgi:predicted RNase H-like HicB family nuclease